VSVRIKLKRAVRRQVATASVVVPSGRGPGWWQTLVGRAHIAEARRLLVTDRDEDGALALVEPYLEGSPVASRAWVLAAEAQERSGELPRALAAARVASGGDASFGARLVHARLALALGAEDAGSAVAALVETRPRNRTEVAAALAVLRGAGHADVGRFRGNLLAWGQPGFDEELAAVHAELDLVAAAPADLDEVLARTTDRLRQPLPVVARALDRRRDWTALADYADRRVAAATSVSQRRAAALELRRAASRALSAGYTEPALRLAGHALARHPDDRYAQATWANAHDQLTVAREGWRAPTASARPRFEPRPRAVLAVLAQSLPHQSGGYATRSHGVLTGLDALGWDVEAVTRLGFPYDRWSKLDPRRVADHDVVDGILYHRVLDATEPGPYPQYPLAAYVDRYAAALAAQVRRHRPALLHASSFHVNGLATRQVAARLGVPYVYEMRGLESLMKVSRDPGFANTDRSRFLETVELASCAGAAKVFVITEALRREMADRGVPQDKLVVLPNGVHTHLFQPRERDAELEHELGLRGTTVIGYAGGLVDYEGLELLLEAVALLKARRAAAARADFRLVVVGDGPHQSAVHATADRLGLGDVVTFTGRVPHEEVGRYLSLFDVTPFPRLPLPVCELISPIKPFESMAMAKAVVVSSVAALTEIVSDGTTGLVFEKGSALDLAAVIGRLLDDPGLRSKLGESARTWVQNERDWSSLVEIVDATYEEVLREHDHLPGRSRAGESLDYVQ
jgi:glycosyltransferase involved in cell wall biosynthesis